MTGLGDTGKVTWYDAQFTDGTTRYTVGPFDTPDDADEFGIAHAQPGLLDYLGHAVRKGRQELERLIGTMILNQGQAEPGRREGVITRWDPGSTHGFLTDSDGGSWFASRDDLPDDHVGPLVHTRVSFVGSPKPKPGKKYPQAYSIRLVEK